MKENLTMETSVVIGADATAVVFTAIQPNEILQWVSLVLTIIATIISIVLSVWRWWKSAKKDGKIDEKELEDLQDIFDDSSKKLGGKNKDDK